MRITQELCLKRVIEPNAIQWTADLNFRAGSTNDKFLVSLFYTHSLENIQI